MAQPIGFAPILGRARGLSSGEYKTGLAIVVLVAFVLADGGKQGLATVCLFSLPQITRALDGRLSERTQID